MTSFFVDDYKQKEIPPTERWAELTFNELLDVRSNLIERQQCFERNPNIWKMIQARLDLLSQFILEKSK